MLLQCTVSECLKLALVSGPLRGKCSGFGYQQPQRGLLLLACEPMPAWPRRGDGCELLSNAIISHAVCCNAHLLLQLVDHVFLLLLQLGLQVDLLTHELQQQQCI